MTVQLDLREAGRPGSFELLVDGEQRGTLVEIEDRDGFRWAWSLFVNGRFGGSANSNARILRKEDALAEAGAWLVKRMAS